MSADEHRNNDPVVETISTPPVPQEKSASEKTRSLILFALLVLLIVLPIRLLVAKPFIVSGTSMFPTFDTWHYLIIDQLSYRFNAPERGDVIVFRFPQNPSRFFIKRIIGLPNETVSLTGTSVTIINSDNPEGFLIDEPYVDAVNNKTSELVMILGDNEYFVMGDNRKASADSRYWGPLEYERIIGRAYIRLFPFSTIDILPGSTTYEFSNEEK